MIVISYLLFYISSGFLQIEKIKDKILNKLKKNTNILYIPEKIDYFLLLPLIHVIDLLKVMHYFSLLGEMANSLRSCLYNALHVCVMSKRIKFEMN
ncbi:unnamed protein product [Larinioides sclopetarius]|uniref:Uncharacterized protein n=1 Tax=Larinioides sclopetarius TaxID=280406 RepID=A0AAV2A6F4_9ARAC